MPSIVFHTRHNQTHTCAHTHLIGIFHCLVRRAPLRPNVSECDRARMVCVYTCVCVTILPALLPLSTACYVHMLVHDCVCSGTQMCEWTHTIVHVCAPMWGCHQVKTWTCLEVSGLTSFPCRWLFNVQAYTHTHTHAPYTQALIFISNMQEALNRHPSTHIQTQAHTHKQIQKCLCVCFQKLAAENI